MQNTNERLALLIDLYFEEIINQEETDELWRYVLDPALADEIKAQLPDVFDATSVEGLNEDRKKDILDYIYTHGTLDKKVTVKLWLRLAVAAAIVLVVFGAGLFYLTRQTNNYVHTNLVAQTDALPGKNAATLTLANGKTIYLSAALKGKLAEESGVSISKTADGQIVYEITGRNSLGKDKINTLSTARGETYVVKLPDGSLVWLNAASSIRYPVSFTGMKLRKVELSGEAYFEVAKDKVHPFVVTTRQLDINVLGTHFNVESYGDEPAVKTTLLEGAVNVSLRSATHLSQMLKPGQQAVYMGNQLSVVPFETEEVMDWKNGKIFFDNESLETIMRKVSRWYDVDLVYHGDVKQLTFQGVLSRTKNLSSILDFFKRAGNLNYTIKGKTVIIDTH
jgi:transmembrane sensor